MKIFDILIENILYKFIGTILFYIFVYPLKIVYLNAPDIFGIGGWGGKNQEDICQQITQTESEFWASREYTYIQCQKIIDKRFQSLLFGVYGILYCFILFSCIYKFIDFVRMKTNKTLLRRVSLKDKQYISLRELSSMYRIYKKKSLSSRKKSPFRLLFNHSFKSQLNDSFSSTSPSKGFNDNPTLISF